MRECEIPDAYPFADLRRAQPLVWRNPHRAPWRTAAEDITLTAEDVADAAERLRRNDPLLSRLFPKERWPISTGRITSSLQQLQPGGAAPLFAKLDSLLPIAGSIKARGGIHEVLSYAERLVADGHAGMVLDDERARRIFRDHCIAVGSTGNLGLSIGVMARALGFSAVVHMSADAKRWKKDLLRSVGAHVVEHTGDYSQAVARGRSEAQRDPRTHFVDDENSRALFLGYAVAGEELRRQLDQRGVCPTVNDPLVVYLPCGVGGGPGGVCFGLTLQYGDAVRCVFVEPTHSPAMLLGLATGRHHEVSVADIGLDNRTVADGLAVGRPSGLVGRSLRRVIDAVVTVPDERLIALTAELYHRDGLRLEPSATAGVAAWEMLRDIDDARRRGTIAHQPSPQHPSLPPLPPLPHPGKAGIHVVWATGGGLLPDDEFARFIS